MWRVWERSQNMSRSLRTYTHDDNQDYTKTEKVRDLGPEFCRMGCDRNNIEPESIPFKSLPISEMFNGRYTV